MFKVYPYKMGSRSATALAKALEAKKVYPDRNYRPRNNHIIINWGNSNVPVWYYQVINNQRGVILNHPVCVGNASNKLKAFKAFEDNEISIPEFTEDRDVVEESLSGVGNLEWLARTKLQGHSGDGIIKIYGNDEVIADAPLYVRYIKKMQEFRIHVFDGTVIDVQQKKKRQEVANDDVDYQVRNHGNGWIYAREDIFVPDEAKNEAISAVAALDLHFGAVDVIYNVRQQKCYVLEVNTSPGLEGTTLDRYVTAFKDFANE